MSTDVRTTFIESARCFADLVDRIPANSWAGPGLGEWDLRSLVGHTSRSLSTVISYLPRLAPVVDVPTALNYYEWVGRFTGADPAAVAERGREAGVALGPDPAAAVHALLDEAAAAVEAVAGDPVIETIAGGMHLSAYLPTRNFELTVHSLDIAAASGLGIELPAQALADALQLATELAARRGDGPAVLLALTGRQALPSNYSAL